MRVLPCGSMKYLKIHLLKIFAKEYMAFFTLSLTVCSDSQIHREIKDKEDARALLDRTLAHLETLTSTNSTLQNQISKQVRLF
jgi:hypothetical protein